MKHQISISQSFHEAISFHLGNGETPEQVLRKFLPRRFWKFKRHSQAFFRVYILKALFISPNYRASRVSVLTMIEAMIGHAFHPGDLRMLNDEPAWKVAASWERDTMVKEGLLEQSFISGRGIWALSERGIELARSLLS